MRNFTVFVPETAVTPSNATGSGSRQHRALGYTGLWVTPDPVHNAGCIVEGVSDVTVY